MASMLRPGSGDAALVIGNPLTTTSRAYLEHKAVLTDGNPKWHRVRLSCLDHPNIAAGLKGEPPPISGAVTAGQVDGWVGDWCDPVASGDERPTDISWRGRFYRPGPVGEPRILGRRPSAGSDGVWSEAVLALAMGPAPAIPPDSIPVIGCDVANYGDDFTAIHTRCGPVSLWHQTGSGWDHLRVAARLRDEATRAAEWANRRPNRTTRPLRPDEIPIHLEDDATGRAVQTVLQAAGYSVRPVNASSRPIRGDLYPNARSELWFLARNKAATGQLNISGLERADRQRLEQQLLAPGWKPDEAGRRVVEPKDVTKKTLGRSPDDADAMNLAYYDGPAGGGPTVVSSPPAVSPLLGTGAGTDWASKRGLFGLGASARAGPRASGTAALSGSSASRRGVRHRPQCRVTSACRCGPGD
jgi:hypothetical protein